ncbi:MAG: signal peptidase I [Actinomycetota bacterium]|nr:signal peptidase I [Actinomycetota bacterium]
MRGPRRLWRVRGVLFWFVRGVLMTIAGAIAVPGMLGYHALTVLSGSMEPAIHTGDVVVERAISPLEARVGDIVIFRDPGDQNIMITHRARAIRVADGIVHFTTKGDANNTVERWTVPVDGSVGLVRFRVKRLGFALVWGSSRSGRLALVVLPALFLGGYELVKIWRPKRKPSGASAT